MNSNQLLQSYQSDSAQSSSEKNNSNQEKTLLILISNQLAMFRSKIKEKESREKNQRDWLIIASVLDRFFLIIYYSLTIFGLLIIFI